MLFRSACGVDALYPGCTGEIGAQGCCPDYAVCQEHEGKLVCVPRGNTCECNENHEGVVRSCVYTGAGGAKCEGTVTCNPDSNDVYQWSECTTVGTTDEVCDGIDNNCDGRSDENFINQKGSGTYDVDEHCGKCHNDCTALWSKTIQHAVGGCVVRNKAPKCEIVACTGETIGGGGLCHEDADCPAGYSCAPPYYQCVRRCQSSGECPTGSTCDNHWCTVNCTKDVDCVAKYGMGSKRRPDRKSVV